MQLFSVHSDPSGALGPPPSATINIPADSSEIEQQVTLPITGNLSRYPFDSYRLLLVGSYPPDSTGVDLVLEGSILLLLLTVAVRAVAFMMPRAYLSVMRPSTRDERGASSGGEDDEVPEIPGDL
ncbi:MAG: hypothetical protein HIU84_05590 [Acidobacteria bacterium]|nr:hypothetical protein [Acidobacteriota bacterium]